MIKNEPHKTKGVKLLSPFGRDKKKIEFPLKVEAFFEDSKKKKHANHIITLFSGGGSIFENKKHSL